MFHRLLLTVALTVLIVACARNARPPAEPIAVEPAAPAPTVRLDLLAEVRAAAADAGDVIEVQPLRDPAVEDLRVTAMAAEQRGDIAASVEALRKALALTPDDPQLMQELAELLLAQDQPGDAEDIASRSYDAGPKLGGLCRRNWTTVQLARAVRGDPEGAARAAEQVARCIVEPQVRM